MKKNYSLIFFALFCLITYDLVAQCNLFLSSTASTVCAGDVVTLSSNATSSTNQIYTTFSGGNSHRGNMFDIYATNTVTITAFDAYPDSNTTVEIYYRTSPYLGFETSPAAWILIGSASVTANASWFTPIPVAINVTIPAGETYSFYVTSTTSVYLNYTNGNAEGVVYRSDSNISIMQGVGLDYPFSNGTGTIYRPRIWNGNIHYAPATTANTTYLWNTSDTTQSITPTISSSTQHTVEVNVTGCPTMYDTIFTLASAPQVYAGNDESICTDSSVTLSGSGVSSYSWNNGITNGVPFTPTATSSYIVTGTDSVGCTATDTVMVFLTVAPTAGFTTSSNGGIIDFTNTSTNGLMYEWDFGDGSPVSYDQDPTYTYTNNGSYTVTLIVSNDCGQDTIIQFINILTAGINNNEKGKIRLTPNPSHGIFNLTFSNYNSSFVQVKIMDIQGKVVYALFENEIIGNHQKQIDISSLAKGVYLLQVYTDIEVQKIKLIVN